ncbi:Neurogenic locus notch 1 [Merluccius polli]|uniref:Neurogenic locus notch 1 n=1 Tax=Merluccius polli TaxID=89951 RepID=A0AA47MN20_MERPO|nr:Neurogenic locus notch 1 [Merluccius polli]
MLLSISPNTWAGCLPNTHIGRHCDKSERVWVFDYRARVVRALSAVSDLVCREGYVGSRCQFRDPCTTERCMNGGTCRSVSRGNTVNLSCTCRPGWTDRLCTTWVDSCTSTPCRNGTTCEPTGLRTYRCRCPPGWSGPLFYHQRVFSAACHTGSTCHDRVASFYCQCPVGRTVGSVSSFRLKSLMAPFAYWFLAELSLQLQFPSPCSSGM